MSGAIFIPQRYHVTVRLEDCVEGECSTSTITGQITLGVRS
jgi:hypothetical protein